MAIAATRTDDWIQHLPFIGGQRPSPYGMVDGVFYGTLATTGDASGGNVTVNGRLSEEKKEDWVYIIGGTHARINGLIGGDVFEQVNTGPLTPTDVLSITNPTFEWGGVNVQITGNAVAFTPVVGQSKVLGLPVFGDKRIPGIFLMYAAGWETNSNTSLYSAQIWGWIIRYQSFFRNVSPQLG